MVTDCYKPTGLNGRLRALTVMGSDTRFLNVMTLLAVWRWV
jgi:hypothetical protein